MESAREISPRTVISIKDMTKTYLGGSFTAVDNVSMEIKEGEIVAFVGPVGLRQDDGDADGRRARRAHGRSRLRQRPNGARTRT